MSAAEQSVKKLFAAGIGELIIGTAGEFGAWYEGLAKKYPLIRVVKNETMNGGPAEPGGGEALRETLRLCAPFITGDFLLLDAGLIYDSAVLTALINAPEENAELAGISRFRRDTLETLLVREVPVFSMPFEGPLGMRLNPSSGPAEAEAARRRIGEAEGLRRIRREILLNPGPATTSDSVKYAQVCPDICPREKEFGRVMKWICGELSLMAGKPGRVETVLFGGSGTAADEVMISSCVPEGGKLLVLDNGAYGARLAKIAGVYKLNFEVYKGSGRSPPDTGRIKERLLDGAFTHLALVYHETTTGLLNPAPELCRFCREHRITTIVDAVSAFAAVPIDMDRDGFDFMASASNKNIQAMAGVGFVFCRGESLEEIKNYPMRNYYLNLWDQYLYFKETGQTRFTPPVQTLYALRQAIIETKLETIEGRYRRYSACWEELVRAVKALGLRMLVPEEHQSRLITAIIDPPSPNYSFDALHDAARKQGFTIYPGKLSDVDTFRIANIGDIKPGEMRAFTDLLGAYMESLNG
ncbi:MAG: 2-aminoethylphosphonate--pyruvate transaminase [Treponema sp.]|jgi:2-aminoethylphosphonate-pyruvate transaminase|nr:2-aminoethylphosphonate--pyruvate transaminase [Treponema sp.]